MLYTHLGRIVAVLGLLIGILWLSVGAWMLYVAQSVELIYTGIQTVLIAIALGVLTEISRSVRANIHNHSNNLPDKAMPPGN